MNRLPPTEFSGKFFALAGEPEEFVPHATYDRDGDCVEFFALPDSFYGERIDDLVTVYRSQDTDEVMGALVKGVRQFCKAVLGKLPGFRIEIVDRRVGVACLFRAKLWSSKSPGKELVITYRKLIACAEKSGVEAELCAV